MLVCLQLLPNKPFRLGYASKYTVVRKRFIELERAAIYSTLNSQCDWFEYFSAHAVLRHYEFLI